MNTLQPEQQKAFAALINQLEQAPESHFFVLSEHETLLALPAVSLVLIDMLLHHAASYHQKQLEIRSLILQSSLKLLFRHEIFLRVDATAITELIEQQLWDYLRHQAQPNFSIVRTVVNLCFREGIMFSDAFLAQLNHAEFPDHSGSVEEHEQQLINFLAEIAVEYQNASVYELAEYLFEQFSQLPAEAAPMIAALLLLADDEKLRDCATLFLLHPHPLFRKAMLEKLPDLAQRKMLRATDLQRLVWLRNWFKPNDHAIFDRVIKQLQRQQLPPPEKAETVSLLYALATPFDHSGLMMLMAVLKRERHYLLFSFVLKQGEGVKDAFITPPLTRKKLNEMRAELPTEMPVVEISEPVLVAVLEHFLESSRTNQHLPLALFLFKEYTCASWGHPQKLDIERISQSLQGQKNRKNKLALADFLEGWANLQPYTEMEISEYITFYMEPQRELWCERFFVTALVFANTANDIQDLYQAGQAILAGMPLLEIVEIRVIAMHSVGRFYRPAEY